MTSDLLRATPFHARVAEANQRNAWQNRGGYTLAADYGDPHAEALAARFGTVMADVSWLWRAMISGERSEEFVSRLFTRDATLLAPDAGLEALWLNDAGGVRGAGTVLRTGRHSFFLVSAINDAQWISEAANLFGVEVRDVTDEMGILALSGPTCAAVLASAGLDTHMEPFTLRRCPWAGLEVWLTNFGHGHEVWCQPDDALIAWDRIARAGRPFALEPAGTAAMDILDLENGVPRPGRDYEPARDGFSPEPSAATHGLVGYVDRHHDFNGRAGFAAVETPRVLCGLLFNSDKPMPHTPLICEGESAGLTLGSLYSPAARRAIALAAVDDDVAGPGNDLQADGVPCRTCALPFLPIPAPIPPATESPPATV